MDKTVFLLVATLLLTSAHGLALEITSVVPNRAAPTTSVVLSGGPFSLQSQIFLGEQLVPASRVLPSQLEFVVPELPAGSYSLTVQEDDDTAIRSFLFEVLALPPMIAAVVPDNLDHCAEDGERLVRVVGNNFRPGVMVLLNGNAVSIRITDAGSLEFRFPELPAGVYGVEVRNADGTTSLPHSLWVNSIPEIISVERDGDFVNRYDMIIRGKNFFYNSILVVREPQNPAIDSTYRLSTFHAGGSDAAGMLMARPGGSLLYSGCDTLVYRRYPLNMQDKELLLQVINPDGKKTDLYPVTLP